MKLCSPASKNGELDYLRAGGTVLGMFEEVRFDEETLVLDPGDLICFYTDGIVEAFDPREESFGEKRLEALLQTARLQPAAEIARPILASVRDFTRGREQHDDMTLIVLQSIGIGDFVPRISLDRRPGADCGCPEATHAGRRSTIMGAGTGSAAAMGHARVSSPRTVCPFPQRARR